MIFCACIPPGIPLKIFATIFTGAVLVEEDLDKRDATVVGAMLVGAVRPRHPRDTYNGPLRLRGGADGAEGAAIDVSACDGKEAAALAACMMPFRQQAFDALMPEVQRLLVREANVAKAWVRIDLGNLQHVYNVTSVKIFKKKHKLKSAISKLFYLLKTH